MANEKRLIYANEAFEMITDFAGQAETRSAYAAFWKAGKAIQQMPTVDAVEVVHGNWVSPYINRYGHPCHCCSVCGFKASYQDKNYCPNCGAKMDGDGNA